MRFEKQGDAYFVHYGDEYIGDILKDSAGEYILSVEVSGFLPAKELLKIANKLDLLNGVD